MSTYSAPSWHGPSSKRRCAWRHTAASYSGQGRRPALAAGPDVWEIVRAWHDLGVPEPEAIPRLAEIASVPAFEIERALRYYADYPHEIDAWIDRMNADTERAFEEWLRQQATAEE